LTFLHRKTGDHLDKLHDKTDGKTVFFSPIGFTKKDITATNSLELAASTEIYLFQIYPFAETDHDSRTPLIKIHHSSNYENSYRPKKDHRTIELVLDPKNHDPKKPFHLNLSGLSEEFISNGGCSKCKKYFGDLNHFPFSYIEGDEYGNYKFSDLDKTVNELIKTLDGKGFFKEFHLHREQ
jgi:hypothetical protein